MFLTDLIVLRKKGFMEVKVKLGWRIKQKINNRNNILRWIKGISLWMKLEEELNYYSKQGTKFTRRSRINVTNIFHPLMIYT